MEPAPQGTGHPQAKMPSCHRIHHELPDCVVLYRRYDEESIRTILTSAGGDAENDIGCENSTIMRIRRWFYLRYRYFEMTLRRLIRKGAFIPVKLPLYPLAEQDDGWLKKLVRAVVNSGGMGTYQFCMEHRRS